MASLGVAPRSVDDRRPGSPAPGWRPDIQGLRALAVLLVVAFHAGLDLPGGYVGVDVFFVISGFVITNLLMRELGTSNRLALGSFYARRARRLLPALAVTIVVVGLAGLFLLSPLGPRRQTAATGAAASVSLANVQLAKASNGYFDVGPEANALLHTWSLSVEEQFYLAFPLLLGLAWRGSRHRARPRQALAAWVTGGAVASFALSWWWTDTDPAVAFYASPARAWEFGVGALLAIAGSRAALAGRASRMVLGALGLGAVLYAGLRFGPTTAFPGIAATLPVLGTAALLVAGTGHSVWSKALGARPLTWIGDRSYGWYLWHWPALVFARATWSIEAGWVLPAVAVAALIPAALSYRLIERPVRRHPQLTGRRVVALAAVCILVPLGVSLAVWSRGDRVAAATAVDVSQQFGPHLDAEGGCNQGDPEATLANVHCSFAVEGSRGRVVLVGDSNAGHLSEGLLAATRAEGYDLTIITADGCPFAALAIVDESGTRALSGDDCRRFVEGTVNRLVDEPPSLVVLASVADLYSDDPTLTFERLDGSGQATERADKTRLWQEGLTTLLQELSAAGVPAAVVHPVAHFSAWDPRECGPGQLERGDCGRTLSIAEVEAMRGEVVRAEEAAAAAAPLADTVDLVPALCRRDECVTNEGSRWLYLDGGHLTTGASESLAPELRDVIAASARPQGSP